MPIIKVREICVPVEEAKKLERWLTVEPTCEEEALPEDKVYSYTADFGDGWEMDIKVCGVKFDKVEESNTAWSEAILFKDGCERCCSQVSDSFIGDWELEADGIEYVTTVKYKPEPGHCPNCGSENVESTGYGEFDGESFYNPCACSDCGCFYTEAYKFETAWVTRLND